MHVVHVCLHGVVHCLVGSCAAYGACICILCGAPFGSFLDLCTTYPIDTIVCIVSLVYYLQSSLASNL